MRKIIVVTGALNGLGRLASNSLARAGHTVYASMRETTGRNALRAAEVRAFAKQHSADLRAIDLDAASQESVDAAIARIISDHRRLDVVVHSADHTVYGPAEAFTPEQLAQLYDNNVVSTQRINRAALPQSRKQGQGLVVWVSSSGMRGGAAPYLGAYFASKAAMDTLAVSYAGELARWRIETSIVVPGFYKKGTNHCAEPKEADPQGIADAIVGVVDTPFGKRPFRVHFNSSDGATIVDGVADCVRAELIRRIGLADILEPKIIG
jgi:NAD(P)-dependent dehydrogenase (short-subunit alcohol dehydrogenase family)